MLFITHLPSPPGALLAAASSPEGHLLVACDSAVAAYAGTTTQGPASSDAARRLWRQAVSGGRVLFAAPLSIDTYLFVTSSGCPGVAHAAVVQVLANGGGQHVCAAVDLACGEGQEQPCQRAAFSNLAPCGDGTFMLMAALWQATVHVLHAQRGGGGTWRLAATPSPLGDVLTAEPGSVVAVESLALGPASAQLAPAGRLHAVLLYSSHRLGSGGLEAVRHVACLELQPGDEALRRCCWFLRNVCPTTSLVAPLPGARTLVAAQTSLLVVDADAPHNKQQASVSLRGTPSAAAALSQAAAVLSDSSGQLLLLDLRRLVATPVATAPLAAGPSCLAYLPHPAQGQQPAGPADSEPDPACCAEPAAGLLFVGSGGGVLLEVPAAALGGSPAATTAEWRVAGGNSEQFGSCLAPLAFAQLVPDPSGCGDARLLAGCGEAPFGRLALGRLAAGLVPLAVGSADLPGTVRLLSLRASPSAARHHYLLLSSDDTTGAAGAWTSVLETGGEGLQSAELPGLHTDAATLLAGPLAGGCMLQVTPQGAHIFAPGSGERRSSWAPPNGTSVTLAAQHGQHVGLACGATVHLLYCSGTGRLQEERQLSLPQQASALSLFQLGPDAGSEGELWLATGLWVTNEVLLQPLSREQPACRLALGSRQCRSVLACQLGSSSGGEPPPYLVVGTSSGELLWWHLDVQQDAFGAASSVVLRECGAARVGLAPVVLHLLPPDPAAAAAAAAYSSPDSSMAATGASPCVLAVADQALVLQPDPVHPLRLTPLRLHGGQGMSAACPLLAAGLPGGRLAYIAGQLTIAGLEADARLRWDELALGGGAAATGAAFHAPSGCAAVGCTDVHGSSSLRLVDVAAMQELGRVPLGAQHSVTALAVLPLACSSAMLACRGEAGGATASAAQHPQQLPGCSQFLVVAVAEDGSAGMLAEQQQQQPPGGGASGDQPWWRQPPQQQVELQPAAQEAGEASSAASVRGRLLFYQWRQGQADSGPPAHELVLHGSCPLPAAAFSLATVLPDLQPHDAGAPAAAGPTSPTSGAGSVSGPQHPLLAAGCDDGTVRLFRVYVDDAGMEARQAVEQGLAAIAAAVEPLQLVDDGGGGSQPAAGPAMETPAGAAAAAAAAAAGAGSTRQQQIWHQQVALQLLGKAPTCNQGVPTSLSVQGSILFALDLLSSLTAYHVQPLATGQPPTLVPLAHDLSGRHLTAALALTETAVLAGAPDSSVLLLQRDPAAERSRQAAARQQFEQALEAGGVAGPGAAAQRFTPSLRHAAQLDAVASHELGGSVVDALPGSLGVPVCPVNELLGGGGTPQGGSSRQQPAATVVCSNGTVECVRLLTPQAHAVLLQLQRAALATAYVDAGDGAAAAAKLRLAGPGAHEGCIDGTSLAAAFTSRSWCARMTKAAPAATIQKARALLESFGLL